MSNVFYLLALLPSPLNGLVTCQAAIVNKNLNKKKKSENFTWYRCVTKTFSTITTPSQFSKVLDLTKTDRRLTLTFCET